MHARQLAEIIRDALVAHSIRSVVINHRLTLEGTITALRHCHVARAENIARIIFHGWPEGVRIAE